MLKYYKKKGIQIFCSLVENSLYQCSLYRGVTVDDFNANESNLKPLTD